MVKLNASNGKFTICWNKFKHIQLFSSRDENKTMSLHTFWRHLKQYAVLSNPVPQWPKHCLHSNFASDPQITHCLGAESKWHEFKQILRYE